jgi:hypothetical protein
MAYADDAAPTSPEAKPEKEDKDGFLANMREQYKSDSKAMQENHEQALDDLRFFAGDQWDDRIRRQRETNGRPCLTTDHLAQHVRQVTGDIRLNKPSVKVRPVDNGADPKTAELFTGLIRNIEQQSMASTAYVRAGANAAICGEGAFRILTLYADDDSFDQDIRIGAIHNPLAVLWDRNARLPTMEDAEHCFVLERFTLEAFKKEWPKASTESFEAEHPQDWVSDWYTNESVLVAEYWCKKPMKRRLAMMPDGTVQEITDLPEPELAQLMVMAAQSEMEMGREPQTPQFRDVDGEKVVRYIVNGAQVLQGPEDWPGRYIPVIPVFGEEIWVGDNLVRRGMVRTAKDPQRMVNYHNSAAVEAVALAPKAPFVGTEKQFEGNEHLWERANTDNQPYLPYKADPAAQGPPQRVHGPQVPAAFLQLKQESVSDLNNATGIHPAGLGQQSNESSGKAILARERQGDVGTFTFVDNLAIAIGYAGKQLVDLIPRIYDGQRVLRVLGEDDSEELMEVNALQPDGSIRHDLTRGKYDVLVQTGPSFSTKRQESAEMMMQFVQTAPEAAGLVMDLIAKNMDWPGAEDIAERFRKQLIAQGVVEADPEKGEQPPPPPPPDPKAIEAESKAAKTQAETEGQQLDNARQMLELALATGQLQQLVQVYVQQALMGAAAVQQGAMAPPGMMPANTNGTPPQPGGF